MTSRRNFIKKGALATTAFALSSLEYKAHTNSSSDKKVNKPIVLSTWNLGIQANEAA
jgi:N4-(beta-N-acetylglucosaminyl)-L-asparaginase